MDISNVNSSLYRGKVGVLEDVGIRRLGILRGDNCILPLG